MSTFKFTELERHGFHILSCRTSFPNETVELLETVIRYALSGVRLKAIIVEKLKMIRRYTFSGTLKEVLRLSDQKDLIKAN